jgi:hypothetical protein
LFTPPSADDDDVDSSHTTLRVTLQRPRNGTALVMSLEGTLPDVGT